MTHIGWPPLPYEEWKDTYETLHLWMQIVGKIRLARMPWINHCWQVTFYPSARGLTTGPMPYGEEHLQIDFDFIAHELVVQTSGGEHRNIPLAPMAVADFYHALMATLTAVGMPVQIYRKPTEMEGQIPFDVDTVHRAYDGEYAHRCWRILRSAADVLRRFRSGFYGKASPVHFFWGSFDLAVTRFSGRTAPPHPGGVPNLPDRVTRDAYSHEVSSCGFWPGGAPAPYPLFYSYAYPEPDGFAAAPIRPSGARYDVALHEFVLPYAAVSEAKDPGEKLLAFLQSSYEAAADLGHWDRRSLEATPPQ
ncbi:MAG TPA: DUF5996 family protein [Casimicrobiaceae bacterium]|jgi:hypothetical protein|nr:DUF5996 family protein [Casimicrobiaceae bacterium]